jgi:hypothetical protein
MPGMSSPARRDFLRSLSPLAVAAVGVPARSLSETSAALHALGQAAIQTDLATNPMPGSGGGTRSRSSRPSSRHLVTPSSNDPISGPASEAPTIKTVFAKRKPPRRSARLS